MLPTLYPWRYRLSAYGRLGLSMSGSVFAILGAFAFGCNGIFIRRAVVKVPDASVGVLISVPFGIPFFMAALIITGQLSTVINLSWQAYVWFSAAGILHYTVGRSLNYKCIKLVGANIATILLNSSVLIAAILGVALLREPLTWNLILGVLLIIFGISIAGLNPEMFRNGQALLSNIPHKAYLFGFGAGAAWGVTPIFIRVGLSGSVSPLVGAFISFIAATLALSASLFNRRRAAALTSMNGPAIGFFSLAGLFSSTANLMRFIALGIAPASVVQPLISISPVFLLGLAFLFNRNLEIFSLPILIGTGTVIIGTILLV